jgi:uncharacterized protein YggE
MLAGASPAAALDRLVDIANDHWVEVTGEGSVNAPPDFARVALGVTTTGKTAGEAMAANANAANTLVSLIKSEGVRSLRHPDLGSVDFANVFATGARPKDRADDHRL